MSDPEGVPVAHLLWNVAPEALDLEHSAGLIMQAVLSRGELADVRWLFHTYGRQRVAEYVLADVRGRRELPRAARKLWAAILCPTVPPAELEDPPGSRWSWPARHAGEAPRTPEPPDA